MQRMEDAGQWEDGLFRAIAVIAALSLTACPAAVRSVSMQPVAEMFRAPPRSICWSPTTRLPDKGPGDPLFRRRGPGLKVDRRQRRRLRQKPIARFGQVQWPSRLLLAIP